MRKIMKNIVSHIMKSDIIDKRFKDKLSDYVYNHVLQKTLGYIGLKEKGNYLYEASTNEQLALRDHDWYRANGDMVKLSHYGYMGENNTI